MSSDTYKTIQASTEGLYKEKGSKFLSFAFPVESVEEIKEIVKEYNKKYYDSRHVCYAYMLGSARDEFRANDDGEPSGTAGRPILGQINSKELTNILIIVVRYFGGILLGTSGLITAYKEAALIAIEEAEIIEKIIDRKIKIRFEYPLMNEVMRIIKDENASVLGQEYENDCLMSLSIRESNADSLTGKLKKVFGISIVEKEEKETEEGTN